MTDQDWEVPTSLQPMESDYAYDLEHALKSIVSLRCFVPADAMTANTLGPEREGSGVVIQESGLILTIGYLVTEAETIWINTHDGRAIPGHALAMDQTTGFGLVQALGKLDLPALDIGDSDALAVGDPCILAAGGGLHHTIANKLAARQEFAGYWEYALEDAFYTTPAHPSWGGAGLIGEDGKLMGIGSLIIQQGGGSQGRRSDMNMVVPISLLPPILPDLLTYGRVNRPPRPWLGMYATEDDDRVIVVGTADSGPAKRAGIEAGDQVISVGKENVLDLGGLWRFVWASGPAGTPIEMRMVRDDQVFDVTVHSIDRTTSLKAPKMH
jgi:S1-C subfamily serine protease